MRYLKVQSQYYCGIDLHSKTMYVCVMDIQGNILFHRNMPNNFTIFNNYVESFLPDMVVGVESSCYYYWLADACALVDISFYLGHAYYMKAISGGKVKNDRIDSKKIADLLRANLFPLAYPYPRQMRSARDLLRRRHYFVQRRAGTYSHLEMLCVQHGIIDLEARLSKNKFARQGLLKLFDDPDIKLMITTDLNFLGSLDPLIRDLECQVIKQAKHHNQHDYVLLRTIPGIGEILALTILYETHDISRFSTVQRYSSYCGVVKCQRSSNGKIIGTKNTKIRNAYLKWAFGQAILKAQAEPKVGKLYERLKSKYGLGRAKSIIAHRFAVAAYFMLKNKQTFDVDKFVQTSKYN